MREAEPPTQGHTVHKMQDLPLNPDVSVSLGLGLPGLMGRENEENRTASSIRISDHNVLV